MVKFKTIKTKEPEFLKLGVPRSQSATILT